jgi:hypothetical protein
VDVGLMKVFIVTREGVYRHEIEGVYLTEAEAREKALEALKSQGDDYHSFDVMWMMVGQPGEHLVSSYVRKDVRGKRNPKTYEKGPILTTEVIVKELSE